MDPDYLATLSAIVGSAHVLTSADDKATFLTDWRGNFRGEALAVVLPATAQAVAEIVLASQTARIAIVPQGGNTGLVGGSVPSPGRPQIVLALKRLREIRAVDTANRTITVEAGVTLAEVQARAAAVDLLYPVSLAAEGTAQIGGTIATNAGGVQVLRYGNTREQVLGLEAVFPDGRLWEGLQGLRKDNTGYDLKQLLIGSEGTLAVVTAATLRLSARPRQQQVAWAGLSDLAAAARLLTRVLADAGDRVTAFEVVSDVCMTLLANHLSLANPLTEAAPWNVLIEWSDPNPDAPLKDWVERVLSAAFEAGEIGDVVIAQSEGQAAALWSLREHTPEAEKRHGKAVKHDISLPVSAIPEFVRTTDALLAAAFPGALIVNFGHLGDGNLHYNLTGRTGADATAIYAASASVNAIVYDQVAKFGGSISAEHGLGQLKREVIAHYKPAVALDAMRAIKAAIDPHHLFNPGKVL
jgi:FAD/FMN-containing dehydrogenase